MNSLHILQGQFLGTNLLIRTLNSSRDVELFVSVGTLCHNFELIEDAVSISCFSVHDTITSTGTFRLIPHRYISKFKNNFH